MRTKGNNPEVIGHIENCPKCSNLMERRKHDMNNEVVRSKTLKRPYYFSEWDYCKPCKFLQHYEKYKVLNENLETCEEKSQLALYFK